jgi:hypothetical protein
MSLRTDLDRLRRDLEPEEPIRLCLHWEPGVCPKGTCTPDTPKIKLRWPEEQDEG